MHKSITMHKPIPHKKQNTPYQMIRGVLFIEKSELLLSFLDCSLSSSQSCDRHTER